MGACSSTLLPPPPPLATVVPNSTLEEDGRTLVALATSLGKSEEWLTNGASSRDVASWRRIKVEGERVTAIYWEGAKLSGAISPAIGCLSSLMTISLTHNPNVCGELPSSLGHIVSLRTLLLNNTSLTGALPPTLANLVNLSTISLDDPPMSISKDPEEVQRFLKTLRPMAEPPTSVHVTLNTTLEEDSETLKLLCKAFGKKEEWLYQMWKCKRFVTSSQLSTLTLPNTHLYLLAFHRIEMAEARVVSVDWSGQNLKGTIPPEIGSLTALMSLEIYSNGIKGTIPAELGNLKSLIELAINDNSISGHIPSSLANLTNLESLGLNDNFFKGQVPDYIENDFERVQGFLCTLGGGDDRPESL